jgi:hypothetical protein
LHYAGAHKKKEGTWRRSLFDLERLGNRIASAGNDGRDDYDFGFFAVLRKFDFNAALGELTSD